MTQEKRHWNFKTTLLSTSNLFFAGLFVILLSVVGAEVWHLPILATAFVRDVGLLLSAVMAGSLLHEKLLRDEMLLTIGDKLDESLRARIPDTEDVAAKVSTEVHKLLCERPPGITGIKLLNEKRRNFSGYYKWVTEQKAQDLFFAGRSVLHRIDADIRNREAASAEKILFRRLKEGSKIKVLFLDPSIDIIERLAKEESQSKVDMLKDIATSLGVCRRLFEILSDNYLELKPDSELTIRVYNRIPYFAYHRQDDEVIVGFYFLSMKGYTSAAYELVDADTKQAFEGHFVEIMSGAVEGTLVDFDGARGRPNFNEELYRKLCAILEKDLGKEKLEELLNGPQITKKPVT